VLNSFQRLLAFIRPSQKFGSSIVNIYLLLTYVSGLIFSGIFNFENRFAGFYNYSIVIPLTSVFVFYLLINIADFKLKRKGLVFIKLKSWLYNDRTVYFLLGLFFLLAVKFKSDYGGNFRHIGPNILLAKKYVALLFFMKVYILSYLYEEFLRFSKAQINYAIPYIRIVIIIVSLFLFMTTVFDLLYILCASVYY